MKDYSKMIQCKVAKKGEMKNESDVSGYNGKYTWKEI